ncbi:MAG: hypothetical protein FVQ79_07455 [Planctomycetes bacterium]|nr:hypothetical protein [Planctomycetota bacterium]
MKGGIVMALVAALIMAAILPSAITTLAATPTRTFNEQFTATSTIAVAEVVTLTQIPVVAGSESVLVNDIVRVDYVLVDATGVITFDNVADPSNVLPDIIKVNYQSVKDFTGIIGTVYDNLPVFLVIGAMLLVLGWFGVTRGSFGGGKGGIGSI